MKLFSNPTAAAIRGADLTVLDFMNVNLQRGGRGKKRENLVDLNANTDPEGIARHEEGVNVRWSVLETFPKRQKVVQQPDITDTDTLRVSFYSCSQERSFPNA